MLTRGSVEREDSTLGAAGKPGLADGVVSPGRAARGEHGLRTLDARNRRRGPWLGDRGCGSRVCGAAQRSGLVRVRRGSSTVRTPGRQVAAGPAGGAARTGGAAPSRAEPRCAAVPRRPAVPRRAQGAPARCWPERWCRADQRCRARRSPHPDRVGAPCYRSSGSVLGSAEAQRGLDVLGVVRPEALQLVEHTVLLSVFGRVVTGVTGRWGRARRGRADAGPSSAH